MKWLIEAKKSANTNIDLAIYYIEMAQAAVEIERAKTLAADEETRNTLGEMIEQLEKQRHKLYAIKLKDI